MRLGEPMIAVRVRATMVRDAKGQIQRTPNVRGFRTTDRRSRHLSNLRTRTGNLSRQRWWIQFPSYVRHYETDIPTFAPSSTRDTAAEVSVRSGEDVTVDIRYRGEPGHSISGTVKVSGTNNASLTLTRAGSASRSRLRFNCPRCEGLFSMD